MKNKNYITIGVIISLFIFIIGFIGPWYNINGEFLGFKVSVNIGLSETTISGGSGSTSIISNIDRGETDNTMYIAIIVIIMAILTLIGVLGTSYNLGKTKTMILIGEIFGYLTFILAIIATVYYTMNLPDTSDFEFVGLNAGLSWGFFLYLIGAIAIFLTVIWSRISKEEET